MGIIHDLQHGQYLLQGHVRVKFIAILFVHVFAIVAWMDVASEAGYLTLQCFCVCV
jgi:hypothetical protein